MIKYLTVEESSPFMAGFFKKIIFFLIPLLISIECFSEIKVFKDKNGVLVITNSSYKADYSITSKFNMKDNDYLNKLIDEISKREGVDSKLIHSIIKTESNYNHNSISKKGAVGIMQLMPETAKKYGVKNIYDLRENLKGGIKYFKDLLNEYEGNVPLALAAYNAGKIAVEKYDGIPPYEETRNYVKKIVSDYGKDKIRLKKTLYKYYDQEGVLNITDSPPLPGKYKGRVEILN
ncbi:MAG: lytic transglycosylase domain-containing protein [Acidobacteriota bacterium]